MSIDNQKYPIYEIIILDDASNDESVQILNDLIPTLKIDCKLITNESNSGHPFVQWCKGVKIARGDYVWIAEADDLSEPAFLSEVLQPFDDPTIVLSYCQSKQMDLDGRILCDDYLDYVSDISPEKWNTCYVQNGIDEICTSLAIKNTIPNVSSVVFHKNTVLKILDERIDEIKSFHIAGDWVTYIYILEYGKIAYSPKSLNLHRRHQNSVTISNFNLSQLEEILAVQQKVRNRFNLCKEVIAKAYAYSQSLYEYFDLDTPKAAELEKHPLLKTYLKN
jgi:glycosyltransferase involved in cell wall biosynthesis